ncbi:MAG TPA: hypothetical protein VH309_09650 [Elusimicrobiota bacterium]|nr:hypothetical protein [Elusimicrobiota bacterium]
MRGAIWALSVSHASAAAFAWGLLKALIPFPTPSFFLLAGAELARASGPGGAFVQVFWRLAMPGAAGGVLGAIPYFYWARRGGWPTVERWAPWLGIRRSQLKSWERKWTERKGKLELLLGAAAMLSLLLGALLAGLGEAGFWEYAAWGFLGGLVRAVILGLAGWRMRNYGDPAALFGPGTLLLWVALAAAAVAWVVWSRGRESGSSRK